MTNTAFVKQDNGQSESMPASGRIYGRESRSRLLLPKKMLSHDTGCRLFGKRSAPRNRYPCGPCGLHLQEPEMLASYELLAQIVKKKSLLF